MAKKLKNEDPRYCPFKKAISTENGYNGKKEMHERFEECAGERCMAYGHGYKPTCLRIENKQC